MIQPTHEHPVAVLGAGPVGLEAALALAERQIPFVVYEAGKRPAAAVRSWGHVRLFSPWRLDVSPRMRRHLEAAGVAVPEDEVCPTGDELVEQVLDPVAALPEVRPHLRLRTRVLAVGRQGLLKHEEIATAARAEHPFRLLLADAAGRESVALAAAVLDCTGTYTHPNTLGDGGIPAPGEAAVAELITRHIPDVEGDAAPWAGCRILVVGAGHSARTAVCKLDHLALRLPETRILWALRGDGTSEPIDDDPLPERAALVRDAAALAAGASPHVRTVLGVVVESVAPNGDGGVRVRLRHRDGSVEQVAVDRVLSLTGYVGDHLLYRQLQVHECYATCGPIKLAAALLGSASGDCLAGGSFGADTLKNPEPGFFILGSKSYGRNSTFLMRTGWEQVDEVLAAWLSPPASER